MGMPHYKGLTWDHPRGYNALAAAARLRREEDGLDISWEKQPLEGFESHPIADLCARYDLVVMDHPHLGEAYDEGCLMALEDVFSGADLAAIKTASVGACAASYYWHGQHWALPLDAATQVCAYRADLFSPPPITWQEVVELARRSGQVALSLAGPHAFLSFLSMCVAFDAAGVEPEDGVFVQPDLGVRVCEFMRELVAYAPKTVINFNPIGILEHMAHGDDVALCPLIYGYVNYAAPTGDARLISFTNAPCTKRGGRMGSVLGGTGIAISKKCAMSDGLKRHLLWLMSDAAQIDFIPAHQGQPAHRAAWQDARVNGLVNNFYSQTWQTMETAYIRPRHHGFIAFQSQGSQWLRDALQSGQTPKAVVEHLNQLFRQSFHMV